MHNARGPLPYDQRTRHRLMPWGEIGKRLGCSADTAHREFNAACRKLKRIPGAFQVLLDTVHAMDASKNDPLQCQSLECRPELQIFFNPGMR